jgi:hypothetical protein
MKIKAVLKKELFEKGMYLFGVWDKPNNEVAWVECAHEFEEFRDEVHYLWNSLFRGLDSNAISYICNEVIDNEIRDDYLQASDLERYSKNYFDNGETEIYSTSAVVGLALLQTVCNICEPWKDKQTVAKLNKKPWDIDTTLIVNAKRMYKEFCERDYTSNKDLRDKYGYSDIKAQAERIWFGLFTERISEQNIYEIRDKVVDSYFGHSYDSEDLETLVDDYLLDKEDYFIEMIATILDICAKMYCIE